MEARLPLSVHGRGGCNRREFARYLVLGSGTLAVGTVGIAAWTQLRTINTGRPRPIVALDQVAVGDTYLFDYPSGNDPAVLLRTSEDDVVAFSQKCTHLGCVVYFQAAEHRGTARATRATSRSRPAPSSPARRRERSAASPSKCVVTPSGRSEASHEDLHDPGSTHDQRRRHLPHHPRVLPGLPHHRCRRGLQHREQVPRLVCGRRVDRTRRSRPRSSPATSGPEDDMATDRRSADRDPVPRLLRAHDGHRHHRHRRRPSRI